MAAIISWLIFTSSSSSSSVDRASTILEGSISKPSSLWSDIRLDAVSLVLLVQSQFRLVILCQRLLSKGWEDLQLQSSGCCSLITSQREQGASELSWIIIGNAPFTSLLCCLPM